VTEPSFTPLPDGRPVPADRAGRRGLRQVAALLLLAVLLAAAAYAGWRALSGLWRSYTHPTYGFTVQYPALWAVKPGGPDDDYDVMFAPPVSLGSDDSMLMVSVNSTLEFANWTANECLMQLKGSVLRTESGRLLDSELLTVAGHPAGLIAYELDDSAGGSMLYRSAMISSGEGAVWLEAGGWQVGMDSLKGLHDRFLAGFKPRVPGALTSLPDPGLQCPQGYDPYLADHAGVATCYPLEWTAFELPDESDPEMVDLFFSSPTDGPLEGYLLVSVLPEPVAGFLPTDGDLLAELTAMAEVDAERMISAPALTTFQGRRAVTGRWENAMEQSGRTGLYTWRMVRVVDRGWNLILGAYGPSDEFAALDAHYEVFLDKMRLGAGESRSP